MKPRPDASISGRIVFVAALILLGLLASTGATPASDATDYSSLDAAMAELEDFETDAPPWKFSGYYKNLYIFRETDDFINRPGDVPIDKNLSYDLNRVRLTVESTPGTPLFLHMDVDNEVILSNYTGSASFDSAHTTRTYNDVFGQGVDGEISDDLYWRLKLHRFYVKHASEHVTVTLGRQLVRFGSGKLWNPLDILNPINPDRIEGADERKGIDALRVAYYPNAFSEITGVWSPQREEDTFGTDTLWNKNTNAILRAKSAVNDTDFAILGGRAGRKWMAGVDVAAILWDGMLRGSIIHAWHDDDDPFTIGSMGYEYTFPNSLNIFVEYFYNQNALNDNALAMEKFQSAQITGITEDNYSFFANQFITFNRHYLGVFLGYEISPLLRGDLFTIYDLDGRGLYLSPTIHYNMLENVDLVATAMFGHVTEKEGTPSDFDQFSDHPVVHVSVQWFF